MKTISIVSHSKVFTAQPVPRASLSAFDMRMREIQAIWIEEGFSTADAIARDDCWEHMQAIAAMLPDHDNPVNVGVDLSLLSNDYHQLERLFFGDAEQAHNSLQAASNEAIATFSIDLFKGCALHELHCFEPKKKLLEAHELSQVKRQQKQSSPKMSRSKAVEMPRQTRSPTSSTALAQPTA